MAKLLVLNAGEVYGKWTVLGPTSRKTHYLCKCECGTEKEVHKNSLKHGYSVSCGCWVAENKRKKTEEELVGQKFGRLTVESHSRSDGASNFWNCKCDCGNVTEVKTGLLKSGTTSSCGCLQKEMRASYGWTAKIDDKTGRKFGRLTAIEISHKNEDGIIYWRCRCDCGTESHLVRAGALNSGEVKSCGCLLVDQAKENFTKHGLSHLREYDIWQSMKERCRNPNYHQYPNYGGRGIKVCERWACSFENFYADMGPAPGDDYSIDRINNDDDYHPDNCRWATRKEQNNNKRNTVYVEYNGEKKALSLLAEELGINRHVLYNRVVMSGESVEEAVNHILSK